MAEPRRVRGASLSRTWQALYDLDSEVHVYGPQWDGNEITWHVDCNLVATVLATICPLLALPFWLWMPVVVWAHGLAAVPMASACVCWAILAR